MTGIHKTLKKVIPKEMKSPIDRKIEKENIRTHESLGKTFSPPKAAAEEPVIPLPDEEEIRRNKRRGTAARGGGRASTILTGGDRETLGG